MAISVWIESSVLRRWAFAIARGGFLVGRGGF